ncbi:LodA/GoxA family CTQ-dependent oxidase [Brucella intermedia]|uniref:LodA/GoxA family CTQ-dependent oxidase n=1 Tax=Brucella intermedia TaxID=94625 RepID=UPI00124C29BF|nr:LodA/GoxA family CTQ-dependent oxidase [Brucella intermedia]KAB2733480.1 catalase [Brucella intermedia]
MARYTYDYVKQTYTMNDDLTADMKTIVDGFIYNKQYKNFQNGQNPGRRGAFIKTHGGAYAKFTISHDALDLSDLHVPLLKKGLFAQEAQYDAWVRFGSDINFEQNDRHSTVGCSIKLFNVPGLNVLDYPFSQDSGSQFTTVDFPLQNYQVFFASDANQMAGYIAAKGNGTLSDFRNRPENEALNEIINGMMASDPSSVLTETYWSCVPFVLGIPENNGVASYCKYILSPRPNQTTLPIKDKTGADFLRADLFDNLKSAPYIFDFYIHLHTSPYQSVDDASDNWMDPNNPDGPETEPFRTNDSKNIYKIGTLEILQQDITQRGQDDYVESLAFNPWRTLPDNVPYGEIALARRISYEIAAKSRRDLNGQSVGEPVSPRPPAFNDAAYDAPEHDTPWSEVGPAVQPDTEIVRVAIHPGIGVARVGNSELNGDQWILGEDNYADIYIGPETDTPPPMTLEKIRDESGRIKRQAARFRLFGFNANGDVVKEILPGNGVNVTWKVTLANRKAQWFTADHAWDTTFFAQEEDRPSGVRNPKVADRASLAITPDPMTITGTGQRSATMTGKFLTEEVTLGELRTDSEGRLLVLGGMGRADTPTPNNPVLNGNEGSFNNSVGWYDDIADGPVHAQVTLNGKTYDADAAWVISAPPNYAPDIIGFRTLYEQLQEVHIEAGMLPMPKKVSFMEHILPSLQRLSNLSWVNKGFHELFGPGKEYDFTDQTLIDQLKTPAAYGSDPYKPKRQEILGKFHSPYEDKCDPQQWPLLYGDSFGEIVDDDTGHALNINNPEDITSLSYIRYAWLKKWADGDFETGSAAPVHASLDDVPLEGQPAMLDKAALHFCLADAFHPGCELTWPMRHASLYRAPFRIREANADEIYVPAQDEQFEYMAAHTPNGGLGVQPPGGLTRWMALPWHGDTARCRAAYDADKPGNYGDYTPAYWPARVPNNVLTFPDYLTVVGHANSSDRLSAFENRQKWWRSLSANPDSREPADEEMQMQYMIHNFDKMGIVLQKDGPIDLENVPDKIYVEHTAG